MPKQIVRNMARTFRLEIVVALVIVVFSALKPVVTPLWTSFEQSRTYRDWAGLTPFRSVIPEVVTVRAGSITVMGTMIKQRDCEIVIQSAWARDQNDVLRIATYQAGPEPNLPPVKRYVSDDPQAFGPIIITPIGDFAPIGAVLFATHDCYVLDENGKRVFIDGQPLMERQSNVFFDVEWKEQP